MTQLSPLLAAALASLDTTNDGHWTNDGQARVDVVNAELANLGGDTVTRQDIIDGAPLFTRETAPAMIEQYHAAVGPLAPRPDDADDTPREPDESLARTPPPAPPPLAPRAPSPVAHQVGQSLDTQPSLPPAGAATRAPKRPATLAALEINPANGKPGAARVDELLGEESALNVPLIELMQSEELLRAAISEMNDKSQELIRTKLRCDQQLSELHAKSELCTRQLDQIRTKEDPHDNVRAYLQQSQRAREERRRRAEKFIDAGTTVRDVIRQLRPSSALDDAMSRRKPAPGSTRPALRAPVGA